MDLPAFTDLDDDLFPFCTAGTVGALQTDEYRVLGRSARTSQPPCRASPTDSCVGR